MRYEFIRLVCGRTRFCLESVVKTIMDTKSIFRRVRKVAKSDCYLSMFVCPHGTSRLPWTDFRKFDGGGFIETEYGCG
jgi:hypothetical protein